MDKAQAIHIGAANIEQTLLVDGNMPDALDYEALLAAEQGGFTTAEVADDEVAMMMYTSGSTGRPKGCLLSHASRWWTARSNVRAMMNVQSDRALIVGPLYHANALWGSLMPMLYIGGSAAILPDFAAVPVIEAIDLYKPTFMSGTPSMYSLMLAEREALQSNDVTSFEYLSCGSAPVPEELMQEINRVFGCEVVESYGLTEAGANVLTPRWGIKKLGSCGLPVMDVEIRIVDAEDESLDWRTRRNRRTLEQRSTQPARLLQAARCYCGKDDARRLREVRRPRVRRRARLHLLPGTHGRHD